MFKPNSRFAALAEPAFNEVISKAEKKESTTDNKPKINNFKSDNDRPVYNERLSNERPSNERPSNDKPVYNDSNLFSQKVIDKAHQQRKDDENQRIMAETAKILSIDNFPELKMSNDKVEKPISFAEKLKQKEKPLQSTSETNDKCLEKPVISFSEKLKQVDVVVENKVKQIPYGWAVIKRDRITNKSSIEYNKEYENDLKRAEMNEKKQWPTKVLYALVDLYERERDTYINKWGYDAYEEKYLDPDYDDEYFDRLDEEYASSESDEEYEDDEDDYNEQSNQYWKH
jgi:hypothetical protein